MFKDFAGVWTPVLLKRDLRNKPVPLRIAGESIVLFRDADGAAAALWDRCPHRGVALSLGTRTRTGTLACPFHAWEFNSRGACTKVPLNPEAKCERLQATAFPVHEGGGLIWLYTAAAPTSVAPPHIPQALTQARNNLFALDVPWKTHWTRAMENMLDNAHLPYVHRRTVGHRLRRALRQDSRMEVTCQSTDTGLFIAGIQDGTRHVGVHEFNRPNGMVLYVDGPPGRIRVHIYCIPVEAERCRLMVVGDFGRWNRLARLFTPLNHYIVLEDREIVESSRPAEVPPPGVEASVATDRGTLQFRKYYYDALKAPPTPAMPRLCSL